MLRAGKSAKQPMAVGQSDNSNNNEEKETDNQVQTRWAKETLCVSKDQNAAKTCPFQENRQRKTMKQKIAIDEEHGRLWSKSNTIMRNTKQNLKMLLPATLQSQPKANNRNSKFAKTHSIMAGERNKTSLRRGHRDKEHSELQIERNITKAGRLWAKEKRRTCW